MAKPRAPPRACPELRAGLGGGWVGTSLFLPEGPGALGKAHVKEVSPGEEHRVPFGLIQTSSRKGSRGAEGQASPGQSSPPLRRGGQSRRAWGGGARQGGRQGRGTYSAGKRVCPLMQGFGFISCFLWVFGGRLGGNRKPAPAQKGLTQDAFPLIPTEAGAAVILSYGGLKGRPSLPCGVFQQV